MKNYGIKPNRYEAKDSDDVKWYCSTQSNAYIDYKKLRGGIDTIKKRNKGFVGEDI